MTNLFIENMSVPEEVEKAIDQKSKIGILQNDTDALMRINAAEAIKDAANNPGGAGAFMGAGVGMGAGFGMGGIMANAFNSNANNQSQQPQTTQTATQNCVSCGANIAKGSKFCPECGAKQPVTAFCPECGAKVDGGAKFCASCGKKL